nr:hypothetical protein [Elusimicrobiota bacterium]
MKTLKATLAVLMGLALLPAMAAAAPSYINYQGRLVDANGNPLSGSYSITFNIYGVSSGGSAVWTEVQPAVTVDNGIFSAKLGSVTALPPSVFASDTRYLGVTIGSDAEMSPRVQLLSVPYAIYAASAASVGSSGQTVDISTGVNVTGNVNASGNVIAAKFVGDGSLLTGISASGSSIILPIVSTHIASGGVLNVNLGTGIDAAKIGGGAVSNTVFAYLANVTSDVQTQLNSKLSSTGDGSGLTGIIQSSATGTYPLSITGNAATATTASSYSGTVNSTQLSGAIPAGLVDLSTVTTALSGKLSNASSVPATLVDLSTVTTALSGKLSNASSVPTTLVDLSTVSAALALKADASGVLSNSATVNPALIDLSTVTTALSGKLSNASSVPTTLVDLSTVTNALSGKLGTALNSANIFVGNGSNLAAAVSMSGDASITNTGVLTIANGAVTAAKMASNSCNSGEVLKYNGAAWACAADNTGAGGTVTGNGITGKVAFWDGGSSLSSTTIHWDGATQRVGIANAVPAEALDVTGNIKLSGFIVAGSGANQITTAAGLVDVSKLSGTVSPALVDLSTVTTALGLKADASAVLANNATVSPGLIDLSTVTTALGGKLSNTVSVPTTLVDLSTVTAKFGAVDATLSTAVYTNGSYADPSWLTSLGASKLTGAISGSVVDFSTVTARFGAVDAALSTGVYTNGSYADPSWLTSLASTKLSGGISAALVDLST